MGRSSVARARPDADSGAGVSRSGQWPAKFVVGPATRILVPPGDTASADIGHYLSDFIGLAAGPTLPVVQPMADPATLLEGVPEASIIGVEAPLWTETVANIRDAEFLAFPRLAGVAGIGWSPASRRDWNDYSVRLGTHALRWSALGLNFYRSPLVPWRD